LLLLYAKANNLEIYINYKKTNKISVEHDLYSQSDA